MRAPLMLMAAISALLAQSTGGFRGQVVDPSGAVIPGASITVTGRGNSARVVASDEAGNFTLPGLAPGDYSFRTTAPGFAAFERTATVAEGRMTTLNIQMTVAVERQEVTISDSQQSQLGVDPSQNAGQLVVQSKELDMLADNPDDLQADLLALAGPSVGPSGGQIFIDGFSNGDLPPKQSIREVRVNNNPFSAEYDQPGFGRVEVLTRPGTDRFRGSAGFNFSDSVFNARNPFSETRPPTQMRQFDFNVTGPLSKRASFTVDAMHLNQDSTALINATVLDASLQPQPVNELIATPNVRTNVAPRIDYAITPNVTFTARYSYYHPNTENNGIGGFTLESRGTNSVQTHQSGQFTLSVLKGSRYVNETRFQYHHTSNHQTGDSSLPAIVVSGAFSGGGAPFNLNYIDEGSYEFQNYSSYTRGAHFLKFGLRARATLLDNYSTNNYNGTFTFTSLDAYRSTLLGLAPPFQYSVTSGEKLASVQQVDVSPYLQDDWKIRPNLTLSLGLRYETQTNIADHSDWAPRVAVAWGLGGGQGRSRAPKTVVRVGYGFFYERVDQNLTLQASRQNGVTQQFFVVPSPPFFPVAPPPEVLAASRQPQAIQLLSSTLQATRNMQAAVTLERQLPKNINLSLSYTNTRGLHQLRDHDINAPLPGTGVYPYGDASPRYLYESSALYKQSQLTLNVNARVNARFSMFGYYSYGRVWSDSDGPNSFPADNYNLANEWGRAGKDARHRAQIGGSVMLPAKIQLAPNITMNSAPPFNITTGTDLNLDTLLTDRPAFATVPAGAVPGVVGTPWGVFNLNPFHNPGAGAVIIPRNYGIAYGRWDISGRISRVWTFGERIGNGGAKRYSLTAGLQGRNWLNHVNPAAPVGNLSSPYFGEALNLQTGSTANRRFEMNLRFGF
jgi:hypothetical protein